MAAPFVEAQSLSDITQLASNPPKYPRNPTEQRRQPLTLYVARVPGSRDIILTTLRPQLKNVTAEDVASSLYYLHVNTDDDVHFLEDARAMVPEETAAEVAASMQKSLPRKPLPESAQPSLNSNPLSKPLMALPYREEGSAAITQSQSTNKARQLIPRRPLGPRPQQNDMDFERRQLPEDEKSPIKVSEEQPINPRVSSETMGRHAHEDSASTDPYTADSTPHDTFTITLIRRDPSSSAQWNIGTVSGHPIGDEGHDRRGKPSPLSKKAFFDVRIELTTPGYTSFRDSQSVSSSGDGGVSHRRSTAQYAAGASHDVERSQANSGTSFTREVRMEGSSYWARNSMQYKRASSDLSSRQGTTRARSFSGSSATEVSENVHLGALDPSDLQSKGYVFLSPWGGRCKFSTGSAGRSLRCKHTLPGPSGSPESLATAQAPATISELRFNLPGADVVASATSALKKKVEESGLREKFGHFRQKLSSERVSPPTLTRPDPTSYAAMYPSDDDEPPPLPPRLNRTPFTTDSSDEGERPPLPERVTTGSHGANSWIDQEDSRLDLSLGQEKAGGGNRGKRAKLGKLIIHDEGFKMLDLVVAANMGIWWSVWDSDNH